MRVTTLEQLVKAGALKDKRVFIRSDLNAPRDENGNITNEARLVASVPAIRMARDAGARVMVVSHLGRPKEGEKTPADSLEKIAQRMAELLGSPVGLTIGLTAALKWLPVKWLCLKTAVATWAKRSARKSSLRSTVRSVTFL